jgi:hypothetical protein
MVDMHLPLNSGYNSRTQNLLRAVCRLSSATTIVREGLEEVSTCNAYIRAVKRRIPKRGNQRCEKRIYILVTYVCLLS